MLKVHSKPLLRTPALLCAFGGWADAASAATGAMRYLLLKRDGQRIAEFEPEQIYQYTQTRPLTVIDEHGRHLQWPELAMTAIQVPEASRDLIVLLGPEPDLRWQESVQRLAAFATELEVSLVLTFGAFLAQVHYSGPVAMIGVASEPRLRARLSKLGISESNYQGPTGFATAVSLEAAGRGIPSAGLWVAAPSYLGNTSNPKLAAALLGGAEQLLGQSLWKTELETAGRDMERRVEEALRERPDLASFLRKLSGEPAETHEAEEPAPEAEMELPSAEELLRSLEEHLRRSRGDTGDADES